MDLRKLALPIVLFSTGLLPHRIASAQVPATGPAPAAPAPEEVALDAARTRTGIPENDPVINAWIAYRLATLTKGLDDPTVDAAAEFVKAYQRESTHAQNSKDFIARLADQSGKRFAAEFRKDAELEPTVAMALGRTLMALQNVATMPALTAGLKAKARPAVRYYCAKTLALLVPAIQADQRLTDETLKLLRDAGAQESSGVVLQQIYEAMFYRERLGVAFPLILEVLQAQLKGRENKERPGPNEADETLFAFIKRELANIQDKNRLVGMLAAHLRLDVERFRTPGVIDDEKQAIERCIDAIEGLLIQIVAPTPPPNLREAMKKVENQDINMPLELYKWIGTAQTRGVLNDAPWNIPAGAPLPG